MLINSVPAPPVAAQGASPDTGGGLELGDLLAIGGLVLLNLMAFGTAALRLLARQPGGRAGTASPV